MDRLADVLGCVRRKGVRLWSENGELHYEAPKGALTQREAQKLRDFKRQIITLLDRTSPAVDIEPPIEPRVRHGRAPLAFSQLAHWNFYELQERRSIRIVASAMRLRGRLCIDSLEESLAEVVRRHEALRTRIISVGGTPVQEISESNECRLEVCNLTSAPQRFHEFEIQRQMEQLIMTPIDVAAGPMIGMRLLELGDDERVLLLAMEHMISDGTSLNILLRELLSGYIQITRGHPFCLPGIPLQFADYAVWQRNSLERMIERNRAYWDTLSRCEPARFPPGGNTSAVTKFWWAAVPVKIDRALKAELHEWCRLQQTTIVMSVFTAFVALVCRWCSAGSDRVFQYQANGRASPQLENTIGCCTSAFYLRLGIYKNDSFLDLLNRVTQQYCLASEHPDSSYLAAQVPRPEFTRGMAFNWSPISAGENPYAAHVSETTLTCSPVRFGYPMLWNLGMDGEPAVQFRDADDECAGDVHFPMSRFSAETMERFGRNLLAFIGALIRQPEGSIEKMTLCN